MIRSVLLLATFLAFLFPFTIAFHAPSASSSTPSTSRSIYRARSIPGARPIAASVHKRMASLKMSGEDGEDSSSKAVISPDGTFYDDEVDSAPKKEGLSESMRTRLMQEAATGLDSNQKQPNVLLYISLGVAVLVVLGGAGIFY